MTRKAVWRDGSVEIVNPDGYSPAMLGPLPRDYSEQTHEPDFERKRFVRRTVAFRFPTVQPTIDAIHTRKALEARALQAGLSEYHWPMIAAEAVAIGIEADALAKEIIDRDNDVIANEVARRIMKRNLSTSGDQQ